MKIRKLSVEIIPKYFSPGPYIPVLEITVDCNGKIIQKHKIIDDDDFIPLFERMMEYAVKEIIEEYKSTLNRDDVFNKRRTP